MSEQTSVVDVSARESYKEAQNDTSQSQERVFRDEGERNGSQEKMILLVGWYGPDDSEVCGEFLLLL